MNRKSMQLPNKQDIDAQEHKLIVQGYRQVKPRKQLKPGEYFRGESSDFESNRCVYQIEWEVK